MGNYKFKLSDMMPNAWFYKLRDMRSKPKNTHPLRKKQLPSSYPQFQSRPSLSQPRHATSSYQYHYSTTTAAAASSETETAIDKFCTSSSFINSNNHFLEPPPAAAGKSSNSNKINSKRKSIYKPSPKRTDDASVSTHCNCRAVMLNSPLTLTLREKSPPPPVRYIKELDSAPEFYGSHRCRITASSTDIIIDVNGKSFPRKIDSLGRFQYEADSVIPEPEPEPEPEKELEISPILTKPIKPNVVIASELEQQGRDDSTGKTKKKTKKKKKQPDGIAGTTSSRSLTGIKLRGNSPRMASNKSNQMEVGGSRRRRRRSVWSSGKKRNLSGESFAIVKSSFDPETDFKDSMVEMIIENNIRASKDLEELLALYLSLNSDEYHDLIVKAFEQIWFDMAHLRL